MQTYHVLVFSGLHFCSFVITFLSSFMFTTEGYIPACAHSLDPIFLTLDEFQTWDLLWYPLTCGPRGGVCHIGAHGAEISIQFCALAGV